MRVFPAFITYFLILPSLYSQQFDQVKDPFINITVEEGLTQNAIQSFAQDKYGFMWIGTRGGLNRYDGDNVEQFVSDPDDSLSLSDNAIWSLETDDDGNLWIGTSLGINHFSYRQNGFRNYLYDTENTDDPRNLVRDIYIGDSNKILIGSHGGLLTFNKNTKEFKNTGVTDIAVRDILKHNNKYYLATNEGLIITNDNLKLIRRIYYDDSNLNNSIENIFYCLLLRENTLFIGGQMGLFSINITEENAELNAVDRTMGIVTGISLDNTNKLWISAGYFYHEKDDGGFQIIENPVLDDPRLIGGTAIVIDDSNNIWLGTNGYGIYYYNNYRLPIYYLGNKPYPWVDIPGDHVKAINTINDTIIWVASINGIVKIDKLNKTSHLYDLKNSVLDMVRLPGSNTGYITGSVGFGRFDFDTGTFTQISKDYGGWELEVYKDSLILVATTGPGLVTYNIKSKELRSRETEIVVGRTISIIDDEIWMGTPNKGIRVYNEEFKLIKTYTYNLKIPYSISGNNIKCIIEDREGNIWIGTWGNGLNLYLPDKDGFKKFSTKDGLSDNTIYGILEEGDELWMSTNNGLNVYNRKSKEFLFYGKNYGLQSSEFNTSSYFKSPSGMMYFGGIKGLNYFNPDVFEYKNVFPRTHITELYFNNNLIVPWESEVLNKELILVDTLKLDYDNHREIGIKIVGIDYNHEANTNFKYKLEGYNDDWTELSNRNFIYIPPLEPDTYNLKVYPTHLNKMGTDGDSITIIINTPIFKTVFFKIFIVLLVGVLIFLIYKIRVKYLERLNANLEVLVKTRTNEIERQKQELANQSNIIRARNLELEDIKTNLEVKIAKQTKDIVRANEELVDQNIRLEQYAYMTAHNINSPIKRIKGLLNLLDIHIKKKGENSESEDYIKMIRESNNSLEEVVADINHTLTIKKEAQKSFTRVNIADQVKEVVANLKNEIKANNISIKMPQMGEAYTRGVSSYIHSIAFNLIHNAIKYCNKDDPKIEIDIMEETDYYILTVQDNGIGIDMKYAREKLFKLYQRFNTKYPGKGMGLFLVKTQVDILKGKIDVDSNLNEGTTFRVYFIKDK